jgi:hypothetical protein
MCLAASGNIGGYGGGCGKFVNVVIAVSLVTLVTSILKEKYKIGSKGEVQTGGQVDTGGAHA